jgi:hypothetical protein
MYTRDIYHNLTVDTPMGSRCGWLLDAKPENGNFHRSYVIVNGYKTGETTDCSERSAENEAHRHAESGQGMNLCAR